jgi:hypothetical protein
MHLTDEQLNEYLDHETNERAPMEAHLALCADCARRMRELEVLFSEIGSLPELAISPEFSTHFTPNRSEWVVLPPSLTLAMLLEAVLAVVAIIVAAPFVAELVRFYLPGLSAPSPVDLFLPIQTVWTAWLDTLSTFSFPVPEIPRVNVSSLFMMLTVIGASLLWLIGNGLLLRNQMK